MSFSERLKTDLKFKFWFLSIIYLTNFIFINLIVFLLAPLSNAIVFCVITFFINSFIILYNYKRVKRITALQSQIENANSNHINISIVGQNLQPESHNYDYQILAHHSPKSMTYQVPALAPPTYDEAVQSTSKTNLQVN